MGCNCGNKKKVINNLNSPVHLEQAKISFQEVNSKEISELDDFDKMEINRIYLSLYPNSNGIPSLEGQIRDIKDALEIYDRRYRISRNKVS